MSTNLFYSYRLVLLVSMAALLLSGCTYERVVELRAPELEARAQLTAEKLGLTDKPIQQYTEIVLIPHVERPGSFVSLTYQLEQPNEETIEHIRSILLSDEAWKDISEDDSYFYVYNYDTGGWRYRKSSPRLNFRCATSLKSKTNKTAEYQMVGIESSITLDEEADQIQIVLFTAVGDRYRCWLQNYN